MKVAIIDDEDSGRNIIQQYLSLYCDDIEVVGEANSVKSGLELLSKDPRVSPARNRGSKCD